MPQDPQEREPIVIRADDDSVLSELMSYIKEAKKSLLQEMAQSLMDEKVTQATINSGRIYQLDEIVDVIRETIEEQTKGNGDEPADPTRFTAN